MALGGQDCGVGLLKVGIGHGTLAIECQERLPQLPSSRRIALAERNTNDFACVTVDREPEPALVLFAPDEGPQLVALDW